MSTTTVPTSIRIPGFEASYADRAIPQAPLCAESRDNLRMARILIELAVADARMPPDSMRRNHSLIGHLDAALTAVERATA